MKIFLLRALRCVCFVYAVVCIEASAADADKAGNVQVDYSSSENSGTEEPKSRDFWPFSLAKTDASTNTSSELSTDRTHKFEVAKVRARLMTSADVHGQDADLSMSEYSASVRVPVYHDERFNLSFSSAFSETHLSGGMKLNNTDPSIYGPSAALGAALPEDLYTLNFGLNSRYTINSELFGGFFNDMTLGFDNYLGSRSDKLFNSADEVEFTSIGSVRIPIFERQSITFLAGYSGSERIPIGGVAYDIEWGKESNISIGFPMGKAHINSADTGLIESDRFNFDYNWTFLSNLDARLSYDIIMDKLQTYARYQWRKEHWMRSDRTDKDDRIMYTDTMFGGGLRYDFFKNFYIEGECGLVAGRKIWEGHSGFNNDSDHGNRLANSFYGALSVGITF